MKKYLFLVVAAMVVSGCSGPVIKHFKVFTEPADSDIRVVTGMELKELKYRSPASITAEEPKDPSLAAGAVLEVRRENYTTKTIALSDIHDGDTLNIKLERILRDIVKYRLKYRLVRPVVSYDLQFRDKIIGMSLSITEQSFQMNVQNLTSSDIKILWERAEYTDVNNQSHRIMPSGIVRYQDRNSAQPDQYVLSGASVQLTLVPVSNVFVSPQKKSYDVRPLFPLDSDAAAGLKGKSFLLFIPVEFDRQIIPYGFKVEITDAVKEMTEG